MGNYQIADDIIVTMELLEMTGDEMAGSIGISRATLNRWKSGKTIPDWEKMSVFYSMAFKKQIRLNKIKEQLYREDYISNNDVILFHGAKTEIDGCLNVNKSKGYNDFGPGFYCGENLEQSVMFVSNFPRSSLYILRFKNVELKGKEFNVDREWMLTIAYYRRRLDDYKDTGLVRNLVSEVEGADYIVAPIADNRMFEIIDSFINGEITDVQCQHCLSATNLGRQYVFKTQNALEHVDILEHCFLAQEEKIFYIESRKESTSIGLDKVKVARRQYRGQGKYIEEILE